MTDNKIIVFENEDFGELRTVEIDGEVWFVGKDVAMILGYGNGKVKSKALANAIKDHVDIEDKRFLNYDELKAYQNGDLKNISHYGMTIINENGLYSLVFGSKLSTAKNFKHWVTSEVLPSLRKTGTYNTQAFEELKAEVINLKEELEKNKLPKKTYSPWFGCMHPKYKLIEDSLGITRGALYREILKELANRYGLDTYQIEQDYLYENCLDKCYPLDPYQCVPQYRNMIEDIINEYLISYSLADKNDIIATKKYQTIFSKTNSKTDYNESYLNTEDGDNNE